MNISNFPQAKYFAHAKLMDPAPIIVPGLKLGQTANLLAGYLSGWVAGDASTAPFRAPGTAALPTHDVEIFPVAPSYWQLPRITLHTDTNSLLSSIFPYRVEPLTGEIGAFSLPSGPLMVDDLDAAKCRAELSDYLGVDLDAGYSYMLVELVRSVGSASFSYEVGGGNDAERQLLPEALNIVSSLPGVAGGFDPNHRLVASDAGFFLDCFRSLGTH